MKTKRTRNIQKVENCNQKKRQKRHTENVRRNRSRRITKKEGKRKEKEKDLDALPCPAMPFLPVS